MNLTLYTTQNKFDDMWDAVHKIRKNGKNVTVSKEALEGLLMDHSKLVDALHPFRKFGRY